jgi:hypothetical protein
VYQYFFLPENEVVTCYEYINNYTPKAMKKLIFDFKLMLIIIKQNLIQVSLNNLIYTRNIILFD